MTRDIRESALYREAEAHYLAARQPGTGQISDAAEVNVAPDGRSAMFSGTLADKLEGTLPTRICRIDLASGETRALTFGPNIDRQPRHSPTGREIAFLSDRDEAGRFQLYLLEAATGAARPAPKVEGSVEQHCWSPDGQLILLIVFGDWRRLYVYERATARMRLVGAAGLNVWEAAWCGNDAVAVVASESAAEGSWYRARLQLIDPERGTAREIYRPQYQIGLPSASPSGKHVAIIDALCSDRGIVAGDIVLIDPATGVTERLDTAGVDVACCEWRSDGVLLLGGHRGFESVIGVYRIDERRFTETWRSTDLTTGSRYLSLSGMGEGGDAVLVGEGYFRAPQIAVIQRGQYRPLRCLSAGTEFCGLDGVLATTEPVQWHAPDGLPIEGWLLRPRGRGPHPLILSAHSGPVWHSRPAWLGRAGVQWLMLLARGCAIFFPNPRGSSGRGQPFARAVLGDMGGADTYDLLSGVDCLVGEGVADPERLGVTGFSYGGFMTSWLITQDPRFAAAAAVAPVNNYVSERLLSNIPEWPDLFLADRYVNAHGKYWQRSPVMHASKVKTPLLGICGALDRSAPPAEAMQFHRALLERGVRSELVTYPEEAHGIRGFPAVIDCTARIVGWFAEHLETSGLCPT